MTVKTVCLRTTALSLLTVGRLVHAEPDAPANAAADSSVLEDVVVTARKRTEREIDVPSSLTVFSADDLANQQIKGVDGLANSVPSLFYQQRGGLETAITIRGVGGDPRNISLESGVSVAIDGAPIGRTNAYNTGLYDIEQIEVLRGPQGTLFGTNTIGGLINITTQKPTAETTGSAFIDYGNYASTRAGISVSGQLAENLFGGIAVAERSGGNYITDLTTHQSMEGHNELGGRAELRWVPSDVFEVNLSGDWTRDNQRYMLQQVIPPFVGAAVADPPPNRFTVTAGQPSTSDVETYGYIANIDYHLNPATTFTSVTSFRYNDTDIYSDGDSLAVNLNASGPFTDQSHQVTQEFRVSSAANTAVQYVAGVYFENELAKAFRVISVDGSVPEGAITNAQINTDTYAAFANADYHITDVLTLTGGIRYNVEDKDGFYYQYRQTDPALTFAFPSLSRRDAAPSWTSSLKYKITPDVVTYATFSTGHKSGGFNVDLLGSPASTAQSIQYKPESIKSYEMGVKGDYFERVLSLNADIFYLDYTDRQVSEYEATQTGLAYINITNAGKSRTYGYELEGTVRLPYETTIGASLSHLNGRYTSFPDATPAGGSYTGHVTEFTPDYTATVNLDKIKEVSSGQLVFHGDAHYQGNTYLDASQNPENFQSGYWLFDARVGYEFFPGKSTNKVGVYFYGKNLANKEYLVFARFANTTNEGLYGDPRMYGIEIKAKF
jgi:iron complex outermembrane recepter protein